MDKMRKNTGTDIKRKKDLKKNVNCNLFFLRNGMRETSSSFTKFAIE
jgi:hypothetical protein